ncbi:molybdopterin-binding domain of aldehyde dehydrogenase family protein [Delftia acidovorans]|uniref:xanthine dehydrogenase family protein molybdopterin-binding subunit n=1 Tax=Delftia acidovorans TaxID=80866 RepID=UPI00050756A6|nr:molybdopterin cofactor-binding domain-containing protein [Delftia acidovorans]KFJ12022.1 molybdopterin-binding domain of aldehyde dehydrogenase family protein [Delftia acidovorans]QQB48619.1 xanthine dehydrogenase family protein molybdopterin-binding subunit [Delftia acidovorans]
MPQRPSNERGRTAGSAISLRRRHLLQSAAALLVAPAAGSLLIPLAQAAPAEAGAAAATASSIGDWVWIEPSGQVVIGVSQCEVGQGIYTGLPQVLADELDADWASVTVRFVTGRDAYRNDAGEMPFQQFVGASMSMNYFYERMRLAGAQARDVLLRAGAARLGVRASQCSTRAGRVLHSATGRSVGYGEIVAEASRLPLAARPRMKSASEQGLIGRNLRRVDTPAKVDGSAVFGIDVEVPGMLIGAVRMAPSVTGRIVRIRNEGEVSARPGVHAVVRTTQWPDPEPSTVVVVADSYWIAKQAADALDIEFDAGAAAGVDSERIHAQFVAGLASDKAVVARSLGKPREMLAAGKPITADYHSPYITHATMEPLAATVHVRDGEVETWGPYQGQDFLRGELGKACGVPADKVIVHTTFLGGSFGRKYMPDFALHAAAASKAVGRPVKVIRSREDDIRHSYYRPGASGRLSAVLGADGLPAALHARISGQSLYGAINPKKMADAGGWDETMVESIYDLIYGVPNLLVDAVDVQQPIPLSYLRSVGTTSSVFFLESFISELAHTAGVDDYQYRRRLLAGQPLALGVLDAAARAARWEQPVPAGLHRAMTFNVYTGRGESFQTFVALVMELRVVEGRVRLERAICAIDAGRVVNPGLVKANVEGGIGFALTNTFKSRLGFDKGVVQQSNFHDYPLLQLSEMPRVEVVLVESDRPPQGCGEVALGPTAPAVATALFHATGRRFRSMPLPQDIAST